jgi:hypothetical protein
MSKVAAALDIDAELRQQAKKYARQFKSGRSLGSLQNYAFEDFLVGARTAKELIGETKPEQCGETLKQIEAIIAWLRTQQTSISGTIIATPIVDETISRLEECLRKSIRDMTSEPQRAT